MPDKLVALLFYITKAIEQTSKFTEVIAKFRQKKINGCMPKTVVSSNFKAHQLGLAGLIS